MQRCLYVVSHRLAYRPSSPLQIKSNIMRQSRRVSVGTFVNLRFHPHLALFSMSEPTAQASFSPADAALLLEVAELVVGALNLEISAAGVQADEPLYGDGLGLDSIDILEIALVVSKHYGLQLRADHADNHAIFHSLRSLSDYIAAHRTK